MGQVPSSILPRVSALLRMLASPIDAETIGAARALGRTLTGAGCDFHDLADRIQQRAPEPVRSPPPRPAQPEPAGSVLWRAAQRRAVAAKLRTGLHSRAFTSWEEKFAADIADMIEIRRRCRFSPKQISTAEELAAKVERRSCHA